jgi:hypothetical protein
VLSAAQAGHAAGKPSGAAGKPSGAAAWGAHGLQRHLSDPGAHRHPGDARDRGRPARLWVAHRYPSLLRSAGFVDVEEHDLTPAYLATARRKLSEEERLVDGMVEMLGPEEFAETQARRRRAVGAIADGFLRRSRFVARRPGR